MMAALTDHPSVSRCLQQVRFNPESEWMLFDHDRIIWQFPPVTRSKFVRHTVHYRRCAALALGLYAGRHRPADRSPDPSAENAGHERQKRRALHSRSDWRDADPARFSSSTSYAPDRKRLQELVDLADLGDAAALRAYAIKVYYSAALKMDRFRYRCIIALEARARQAAAA